MGSWRYNYTLWHYPGAHAQKRIVAKQCSERTAEKWTPLQTHLCTHRERNGSKIKEWKKRHTNTWACKKGITASSLIRKAVWPHQVHDYVIQKAHFEFI